MGKSGDVNCGWIADSAGDLSAAVPVGDGNLGGEFQREAWAKACIWKSIKEAAETVDDGRWPGFRKNRAAPPVPWSADHVPTGHLIKDSRA